jgi:hypothetical protein
MTGWRKKQVADAIGAREKCDIMLAALLPCQEELQQAWWNSANKAFNESTPLEILDQDPDSVVKYLYCQFSGEYS